MFFRKTSSSHFKANTLVSSTPKLRRPFLREMGGTRSVQLYRELFGPFYFFPPLGVDCDETFPPATVCATLHTSHRCLLVAVGLQKEAAMPGQVLSRVLDSRVSTLFRPRKKLFDYWFVSNNTADTSSEKNLFFSNRLTSSAHHCVFRNRWRRFQRIKEPKSLNNCHWSRKKKFESCLLRAWTCRIIFSLAIRSKVIISNLISRWLFHLFRMKCAKK